MKSDLQMDIISTIHFLNLMETFKGNNQKGSDAVGSISKLWLY